MNLRRVFVFFLICLAAFSFEAPRFLALSYLAPASQVQPTLLIKIGKTTIPWTAREIFIRLQRNEPKFHFGNSILKFLLSAQYDSEAHFRAVSDPFETFLRHQLDIYPVAMAYYLLWKKAPTAAEKERLLRLLMAHYRQWRSGRYFRTAFRMIRDKIWEEELLPPLPVSQSGSASRVLALADLLIATQREAEKPPPPTLSTNGRAAPRRSLVSDWASALRQEALSQFEDLKKRLQKSDSLTFFTLKTPYKRSRPLKVEIHFKNKEELRPFKFSASPFKIKSFFMIQAQRRRMRVEFAHPIEIGQFPPPFLKLSCKNRSGELVEEYLDFYPDGTYKFQEEPIDLQRSGAIQKRGEIFVVDLPELANLLGKRSEVLSRFYFPDHPGEGAAEENGNIFEESI